MTDKQYLEWRGVRGEPCERCGGRGSYLYGSGATWIGGMGTAAMTLGICDSCWGSGEKDNPWENLQTLLTRARQWDNDQALQYLQRRMGVMFADVRNCVVELSMLCTKESRRRNNNYWRTSAWSALAGIFKDIAG